MSNSNGLQKTLNNFIREIEKNNSLFKDYQQKREKADFAFETGQFKEAKKLYQQAGNALYKYAIRQTDQTKKNDLIEKAKQICFLGDIKQKLLYIDEYQQNYEKANAANEAEKYREAKELYSYAREKLLMIMKLEEDETQKRNIIELSNDLLHLMNIMDKYIMLDEESSNKTKHMTDMENSMEKLKKIKAPRTNSGFSGQTKREKVVSTSSDYIPHKNIQTKINQNSATINNLLEELNSLTGLETVKNQVRKRIYAIQVEQAAKKAGSSRNFNTGSLHMIFTGNPGTGKTTVARLIGKIYAELGVIEDGNKFIETDRSGLVGKYVGHTAQLVNDKVNEALGGILFIDEAYSLYKEGSGVDYGEEAIATLVKCMEDHRDNLAVILAGYTDLMKNFIDKANPGLKSRFRTWITFEDYSINEMIEIFHVMLKNKGMYLSKDAIEPLQVLIKKRAAEPNFGNGRGVRNLLEDILDENNTRLAKLIQSGAKPNFDIIEADDINILLNK